MGSSYFREAETAILRHEDAGSVAGCALQPDETEAFIEELDPLRDAGTAIKGIFVDASPLVSGIRRLLETIDAFLHDDSPEDDNDHSIKAVDGPMRQAHPDQFSF